MKGDLYHTSYVRELATMLPPEEHQQIYRMASSQPTEAYSVIKNLFIRNFEDGTKFGSSVEEFERSDRRNRGRERGTKQAAHPSAALAFDIETHDECPCCQDLQKLGMMSDYYVGHVIDKQGKSYFSNCPLYNKMGAERRIQFLQKANHIFPIGGLVRWLEIANMRRRART